MHLEEKDYLEDRVLFSDLFSEDANQNIQQKSMVDVESFSHSFKHYASLCSNSLLKSNLSANEANGVNADVLMQYLVDNNISVYCPFPLDYYAVDNRIPAIAAVIDETLEEFPGIQFFADGTFQEVMVSQAYADEHPVWLIKKEHDYIFNQMLQDSVISMQKAGGVVLPRTTHYEVEFRSIFVTEYMGPLAQGDLEIHLCRSLANPQYDTEEECFKGTFDDQYIVVLPRKYVYNAKRGYDKGWYQINYIFENDWKTTEYQHYFAAYEYDPKYEVESSCTLKGSYKTNKAEVGAEIKVGLKYRSRDDLMALRQLDRDWIFDIIENSTVTYVDDDGRVRDTAVDGCKIYRPSSYLMLSVTKREYYTYPNIQ
ncbi:MAG: hypothetical protein ACI3ZZ_00390 [Candidatus Aphodosoma sp.]